MFGGSGNDDIDAGTDGGADIVIGDNGSMTVGETETVISTSDTVDNDFGGNDTITAGNGPDVIFGGSGDDDIEAGSDTSPDVLVGDNGTATFTSNMLTEIRSTEPSLGGSDVLLAGDGDDVVIGGFGTDYINRLRDNSDVGVDFGNDVILGDSGLATFTSGILTHIETTAPEHGSGDFIFASDGDDVVMGGSGADQIDAGTDSGEDVILGDNGTADFDVVDGRSLPRFIQSTDTSFGGIDSILSGNGFDILLGGSEGDFLDAGGNDTSRDIVFGDHGALTFDADGDLTNATSVAPTVGGNDLILTKLGADIIVGGQGNDVIDGGTDATGDSSQDIVLGDNGEMTFDADGVLIEIHTTNAEIGGEDNITTGGGEDVVMGGAADDQINGGADGDVLLGDSGLAEFDSIDGQSVLRRAESTDTSIGGEDTITGGSGRNVLLGGQANDTITGGADRDFVLGDNGTALFDPTGVLRTLTSTLFETQPADGGDDFITTGNDVDYVIAGPGNDIVGAGGGDTTDIAFGDDGELTFDATGLLVQAKTSNPNDGGNDELYLADGSDIAIGGPGNDRLVAGSNDDVDSGDDIVIGDLGIATFDGNESLATFISTEEEIGGEDLVFAGAGNDIVIGGMADDTILAHSGDDIVFGDSAQLTFANGVWLRLTSTAQETGGNDEILAHAGNDIVVGGTMDDILIGGVNGNDIILGDNGSVVGPDGSADANDIVSTGFTLGGGNDRILVDDGWNHIIGGDGEDIIAGGSSRDWIAGDYADAIRDTSFRMQEFVSIAEDIGGADGISGRAGFDVILGGADGDTIAGHSGRDVILGDSGHILTNAEAIFNIRATAPTIGGEDLLFGNGHDDIIIGGAFTDTIDGADGNDLIVGDLAVAGFTTLFLESVTSINPDVGAADQILAGPGDDKVIGGLGNDNIEGGSDDGEDLIFGDHGHASFDLVNNVSMLREARTQDPFFAGADSIDGGDGPDLIFGGSAADEIQGGTDSADDILVGDNGRATYDASFVLTELTSTDDAIGGTDTLTAGEGNDMVIGGRGFDQIDAGTGVGTDHIIGDSGFMLYDNVGGQSLLRRVESTLPADGHGDNIIAGDGPDVVIAGAGQDNVEGGSDEARDIIVGDNGFVQFDSTGNVEQIQSAFSEIGDADTITTLAGDNFIIGGSANDTITTGPGEDIILGDSGHIAANAGSFISAIAVDFGVGGDDLIESGAGNDFIMGGAANDTIDSSDGDDVIIGDSADARFANGEWLRITSIAQDIGGDDSITAGRDNDVSIGGFGNDLILGGADGDDIILGDNGLVVGNDGSPQANDIITTGFTIGGGNDRILVEDGINHIVGGDGDDAIRGGIDRDWLAGDHADLIRGPGFVMEEFVSTADTLGGVDGVVGGSGSDIILAGTAGDIATGDSGEDFIIGDNGRYITAGDNILRIETTSFEVGGADTLYGGTGSDVVVGGHDGDVIYGGALQGNDVLIGDNATVVRWDGSAVANDVLSTGFTAGGGNDFISVDDGLNLIVGGRGEDSLLGGSQRDYVVGDYGDIERNSGHVITKIDTSVPAPSLGANDLIRTGEGDYNVAIGGAAEDSISTGSGIDLALGDNGRVLFDATNGQSIARLAETTDATVGGNDLIVTGNGIDYVLGGAADDLIGTGADSARDVVMGDHGRLTFNAVGDINRLESLDNAIGGDDGIWSGDGSDIIVGGPLNDFISAGPSDTSDSHSDYVLGDNGIITVRDSGVTERLETTTPNIGHNDEILTGGGSDYVVGGFGDDSISTGSEEDLVLGDNGFANFNTAGQLLDAATDSPELGGRDNISSGSQDDVVFGGFDNDTIHGDDGHDTLFGDNGAVNTVVNDGDPTTIDTATTESPTLGGDDQIFGDAGRDRIAGGTANDTISGGTEHDVIYGDHATFDSSLPDNQFFTSIFTSVADAGGQDIIHGDEGDDFIVAGQDDDQVFGDQGDDDITGGHNVRFGADGDDYVEGGDDADVILGDNGTIHRTLLPGQVDEWEQYPAPFDDVVRTVTRYDDIDRVSGDDTLIGDNATDVPGDIGGDDIIHGQRGDDILAGRGGDDELIGELGDDTITGGDGHDTILGDVGIIDREFIDANTPRVDRNGKWHRDIVLEEVGELTEVIDIDQTPLRLDDPNLAEKLLTTDLLVLSGGYDATGNQLTNADNGAWDTDLLLINLDAANDDTIDGGAGEDFVFGQRGDDTISGGDDNDTIFGDNAENLVPYYTDLPKIAHTYRLIGSSIDGINIEEAGSVITTPFVQNPEELEFNNPYRLPDIHPTITSQRVLDIAGAGPLQRTDGTSTSPFAAVIADIAHHVDVLPGNDDIRGDAGDDFIVADDAYISTPLLTGFQAVDDAADAAHDAFARVAHTLSALGSDYATLNGATAGVPHDVIVASDTIDGGVGDDKIIGDEGLIIVDFILGFPTDAENYVSESVDIQSYFGDLTHIATDFDFMAFAAHHTIVEDLAGVGTTITTSPDVHDYWVGNDTITDDFGQNHITGDHSVILAPNVNGQRFSLIVQETAPIDAEAQAAAIELLTNNLAAQTIALDAHIAANHDVSELVLTTSQLAALPPNFEFDLRIGNDVIQTTGGDDLVIGDFGAYSFPILLETPQTEVEQIDAELRAKILSADMARWLERRHHEFDYVELAAGYQHPTYTERGGAAGEATMEAGNDTISTGTGNDFVLGDSVSVSTSMLFLSPDTRFNERDPEFKVNFLNRRNFELTGHYSRIAVGNLFGIDVIDGGSGDDTLFGQEFNDVLIGGEGVDALYGGTGAGNQVIGDPSIDDVRPGSGDSPSDVLLDLLETYQFDTLSPTTLKLIDDVGNAITESE